jgi:adenosylcobyric acid synthase
LDFDLAAYEIHMGRVEPSGEPPHRPLFALRARNGQPCDTGDGARSDDGLVVGTLLHGILGNDRVRASLVGFLRGRRGWAAAAPGPGTVEPEYDRLASMVREHIGVAPLRRIAGLEPA